MKPSHYITPRSMDEGTWHHSGQALHGFTQQHSGLGDYIFAIVLGIIGAAALVHFLAR